MAVVTLTTGVPGAGKTYVRAARYLVDYFLLEEEGDYYTNFPLNVDEIVDEVYSRQKIRNVFQRFFIKGDAIKEKSYFRDRIHIIPDQFLQSWRHHKSGPWECFDGVNLVGAHIAIDEIHNYLKASEVDKEYLAKWDDFLGEVRHRGCTFEGITQDISSVSDIYLNRVSLRIELIPGEDRRDPYYKILMYDWYNLKAAFTGMFHKTVIQVEKMKDASGKWKPNKSSFFLITPEYFRFYRSYEASLQEKESNSFDSVKSRVPPMPFQRLTKAGVLFWFIRKNFLSLFLRTSLVCIVCWICFFGGAKFLITLVIPKHNKTSLKENNKEKKEDSSKNENLDPFSKFYDQKIEGYLPAFFCENLSLAILRNGTRIYKGFVFSSSTPLQGLSVQEINYTDRSYVLSSGHVFRLRFIAPSEDPGKEKK